MSDTNTENSGKKRPDYLAYAVHSQGGELGPKYLRIGVGFTYKNGSIGVIYDAIPLSGQIVLLGIDQEAKPTALSYGHPSRKADFDACMVRESGQNSFWTTLGMPGGRTVISASSSMPPYRPASWCSACPRREPKRNRGGPQRPPLNGKDYDHAPLAAYHARRHDRSHLARSPHERPIQAP